MYDSFNRKINYLRVSVTDRCNLRCVYCMPEEGVEKIPHDNIISYEKIIEIVKIAVSEGISKVRLTGGEPLVRKGIVNLVQLLSEIEGINDLSMTTNGIFLVQFAEKLKRAGLQRLNISIDTLNPEKYKTLTRGGDLKKLLAGIEAAKLCEFEKIKLNMVVNALTNDEDFRQLKEYAKSNGFELRYIKQMDRLNANFSKVEGGDGGNCEICNRIRLSSDGHFYPCLFSSRRYSIREFGIREALKLAVKNKPADGREVNLKGLYSIGG